MDTILKKKKGYWKLCCGCALLLCILTFTPLVMPFGIYKPQLLGFPYTFWMGIVIAIGLVILTFIGARVHPKE
jgi:Na+/melibiose symporter-like transporter